MKAFVVAIVSLLLVAGPAVGPAAGTAASEPDLAAIRAASERYHDVSIALADGYVAAQACETAVHMGLPASTGGMGVHYFRPELLGVDSPPGARVSGHGLHLDFLHPSILIYEPQADGSMELVAVENLVFEAAWRAAGHDVPPSLHGRRWDHMADDPATAADEAHGFAPHYDQHLWLYRDNPAGTYAPFNPSVSCRHYAGGGATGAGHGAHAGH